ncbi:hypothetical protein ABZ741_33960 [Streptomyces globisporus]|uniref:hypothetical protein n=1 Tax=Streptomyces globisporus TaxID=1908 RepID=UPI00345F4535
MSETSKEREERMARAAAGRRRPPANGDGVPEKRAAVKRTKPVRLTVDLQPAAHRRLKGWAMSVAAVELDVADVPAAEVVRSLIDLLTNVQRDKELRQALTAAVLEDLRANRQ